ncbi:hypothetical protein [Azoarcus olearius]|uniref:hypothetical protein n=1 Tax=Azoarcus sp. (strain BH72) TaxID=418699 RepID=UPI0012EDECE3|nr:hypothetical protein [Azoarcus olearius]
MPTIPTLYHGTSIGWLMQSGLKIQDRPFGEASQAHSFIYSVAELAAWNAKRHTELRIKRGDLSEADFVCNGISFPPALYVYTLQLGNTKFIDWQAPHLPKVHLDAVVKVLKSKHNEAGEKMGILCSSSEAKNL